ncbi:MAG: GNAT family N-acetyltransferase [Pseudomonadota bacterium]
MAEKAARGGEVEIHEAVTPEDRARCLALRVEVFIAEQGVSAALEQDGEDPDCTHWIAKRGAETLGAARIKSALPEGWSAGAALIPGATTGTAADAAGDTEAPSQRGSAVPARTGPGAKIQRVAVARRARGTGLGQALMRAMLASHALVAARPVWLEAQVPALGFYERLGFVAEGPEFLDAGMPHRRMILISPRQAPC